MSDDNPNLYQMYVQNGERAGFWIRRSTWANTCAKARSVGELKGKPPYYGNPKVFADVYDLRSGNLREESAPMPAPGTFKTWHRIDPPGWAVLEGDNNA